MSIIKEDSSKKIALTLLLLFSLLNSFCSKKKPVINISKDSSKVGESKFVSENNFDTSWIIVDIESMGSIYLPSEMEIQKGKYKKLNDKLYEIIGNESKSVVFQQKGLNEFSKDAYNSYARILIKTEITKENDYPNLYESNIMSERELKEIGMFIIDGLRKEYSKQNIKIIKGFGTSEVTVNKMTAIKTSLERKMGDNPNVMVNMYQFLNKDRMHSLTFSYRSNDKEKWEKIFEKVLNTLFIKEMN